MKRANKTVPLLRRSQRQCQERQRFAFTLIELLVAIAIIAILVPDLGISPAEHNVVLTGCGR